jgi:Holliday junction resolvasome RuvABC ATP-dependent DNA helicase subunit
VKRSPPPIPSYSLPDGQAETTIWAVDPSQKSSPALAIKARYCVICGKRLSLWHRLRGRTSHNYCVVEEQERALRAERQAELDRQAELRQRQAAEEEGKRQAELAAEKEREQARLAAEREAYRKSHGFASIVGQEQARKRLWEFAALYLRQGLPPPHVLLTGAEGIGKRTLARAFAAEFGFMLMEASGAAMGASNDLMGVITNVADYGVLVVSDLGRLSKQVAPLLAVALTQFKVDFVVDKGMFARTINIPLKRFTCIGTARAEKDVPTELLDAFHLRVPLADYSQSNLQAVCERIAQTEGLSFTPSTAALIAGISDGKPRQIQLLVRRIKGTGRNAVSEQEAAEILQVLGFNAAGGASVFRPPGLGQLTGVEFEHVICRLLQAMGFRTETTKATGDGGIDIDAVLPGPIVGGLYLIQCKRYAPEATVSVPTVREFYGSLKADRRGAVKGILITTSGFTAQAHAFAANLPIELIDGHKLRELLGRYGIKPETQPVTGGAPPSLFDQ